MDIIAGFEYVSVDYLWFDLRWVWRWAGGGRYGVKLGLGSVELGRGAPLVSGIGTSRRPGLGLPVGGAGAVGRVGESRTREVTGQGGGGMEVRQRRNFVCLGPWLRHMRAKNRVFLYQEYKLIFVTHTLVSGVFCISNAYIHTRAGIYWTDVHATVSS